MRKPDKFEGLLLPNEKVNILGRPAVYYSQDLPTQEFKSLGFKNKKEAVYWKRSGCGIACMQMIIRNITGKDTKFLDLLRLGLNIGAYTEELGWVHQGLINIAEVYGIKGEKKKLSRIEEAAQEIKRGKVLMISVNAGLKEGKDINKNGGHLVFIYGYESDNKAQVKSLLISDPDFWKRYTRDNAWVPAKKVARAWNGNSIAFKTLK